ncbi:MAG: hypothetical protein RL325_462 [Planctomycetota bacterium]|jgi:hypothetical protein
MSPSISTLRWIHRANRLAPVACLAALLGAAWVLSHHAPSDQDQARARAASVRNALGSMPFLAGDWVGTECPLPAGATEILMPTAVLSRRYTELETGRRAMLGIIHCGDVRDMHGHYPPSCYPSSGWRAREGGHDRISVTLEGEAVDVPLYRFSSVDSAGVAREVSVVAFFVLPEGLVTAEMEQLRSRAAKLDISRMGVGQVQVVMDGWPAVAEAEDIARELIGLIPADCIRALKGEPVAGSGVHAGPASRDVRLQGVWGAPLRDEFDGGEP